MVDEKIKRESAHPGEREFEMKRFAWRSTLFGLLMLQAVAQGQSNPPSLRPPAELAPIPTLAFPAPSKGSRPAKEDLPRPLPINLAIAMQLAGTRPIDVNVAARQVEIAALQYDKSRYLLLPNVDIGGDYFRHDGTVQNFTGDLIRSNRSSVMYGAGPNLVVGLNDAIFSPLGARQDLRAHQAIRQAVSNDVMLAVAEAYFTVQQARGEWAGALQIIKDAEVLAERTEKLRGRTGSATGSQSRPHGTGASKTDGVYHRERLTGRRGADSAPCDSNPARWLNRSNPRI